MNYLRLFKRAVRLRGVSLTLILATLGWGVGLPFLFTTTSAASLLQFSATASSSAPNVSTNYIVRATTTNTIGGAGASTTRIYFDPTGGAFSFASLVAGDISVSRAGGGLTNVAAVGSCTGPTTNEVYVANVTNGAQDYFEIITCPGDTVAPGQITINIANAHVTNPNVSSPTSYVVRWTSLDSGGDNGDTRVAIISVVTVTAIVDTSLTFTLSTVASGTPVNGDTTSTTTSATAIGFGVLTVGTSSVAAQRMNVATNALNGFTVTVTQNQNLTSNNGADIDAFNNGNPVPGTAPIAWVNPSNTLGNENTYGHMAIASDDDTLIGGADTFGTSLYAGLTSTSTVVVMYNSGPSDGTTEGIGQARAIYRIMVGALQEAATDYTNQLTYVCTPVF